MAIAQLQSSIYHNSIATSTEGGISLFMSADGQCNFVEASSPESKILHFGIIFGWIEILNISWRSVSCRLHPQQRRFYSSSIPTIDILRWWARKREFEFFAAHESISACRKFYRHFDAYQSHGDVIADCLLLPSYATLSWYYVRWLKHLCSPICCSKFRMNRLSSWNSDALYFLI